jgi:hypothetical protein
MDIQEFREAVLTEVLKLITDKTIEVDGQRLDYQNLNVGHSEPA